MKTISSRAKAGLIVAAVALIGALALGACGGSSSSDDSGGSTLTVGGWGSSYDAATKKYYANPFHAAGGAAIKFDDASGTQVAKLNAQKRADNVTWDMIDSVAGADGFLLDEQGLLEPLPDDLKAKWTKELGPEKVSDFGFTMGNLSYAIVCNMDVMDSCPKTMAEFFDAKAFPQSRELPANAALETLTMAAVAGGMPASKASTTPLDLDADFDTLDGIKSNVRVFWESGDQSEQVLRTGDVDMGLIWSGRAYRLKDEGMNLEINTAGGGYEPGYWTVVADSPNKDEAFKFMDWIASHPKAQAKWATALDYSVPNPKALDYMSKKQASRLADYPPTFKTLAVPNFRWYAQNADEVNTRWQEFLRG